MKFLLLLPALAFPLQLLSQTIFDPPEKSPVYWATPVQTAITVDGKLDETDWKGGQPITNFVQKDPDQGKPISYPTEVRVLFDEQTLYIGAVCHQPRRTIRVQNLQRDFEYFQNDLLGIAIDGFLDKRNTVVFQVTPYSNQRDMEVIDGSEFNTDWDVRWVVRTQIRDSLWTAELAIPWRILRYPEGADRFGVIFARNIRSRNEYASAPGVPRAYSVYRMAYEGLLRGIKPPPPTTNVQLNPYFLLEGADTEESGQSDHSLDVKGGGELKWAINTSTVLDL